MFIKKSKFLRGCAVAVALFCCGLILSQVGCSHKKTNRGHLFRCDWAFEYNRTPWIGCPLDTGCDDDRTCKIEGCKKSGCTGCNQNGFRRHCGISKECTAKEPCCRTLGCGMWIDPTDPNSFAAIGGGIKACGLTPFCSPMKPCALTPFCGRPLPTRQTLVLGNNGVAYPGASPMTPISPTPVQPNAVQPQRDGTPPKPERKTPVIAGPNGLLISMGIVPGVSTISTGGLVAAAGVATPVGVMTPSGVQLPNGTVNNQVVIKACAMNPVCHSGRPCGLTPGCGMLVPVAMVSNNAMMLASALNTPGVAGSVMQAGGIPVGRVGNGTLVNPITGMPVAGLTMNGAPQMGYPPIGYTATGYSPKYPRYDGFGMSPAPEEEEEEEAPMESPITKSQMPVPRFHPVPSKPVFQRSEGMPVTPKTSTSRKISTLMETQEISEGAADEESLAATPQHFSKEALERAYLEGMSAAMAEVEEELETRARQQARQRENARMQAQVLRQAQQLQARLDAPQEAEPQRQREQPRPEQAIRTVNYSDVPRDSVMNQARYQAQSSSRPQPSALQTLPVRQPVPKKESGIAQSARSLGNELMSPFAGLWSSNVRKPVQPTHPMPVRRPQPVSRQQHVAAQSMLCPPAPHSHSPYGQVVCPPRTKPSGQGYDVASDPAMYEPVDGHLSQNVPSRPPTYKKVIESGEVETDSDVFSLVQQANFVDQN